MDSIMHEDKNGVNSILSPFVEKDVTAIIRAYGDEPVRLRVLGTRGRAIEVFNDDPNRSLCISSSFIYRDAAGLFEQLRGAYERGNREELIGLWRTAEKFNVSG